MPALVRPLLLALCCAPLVTAQNDRRPESYQIAIGLQQRGLHDEAIGYLDRFLREHPQHALAAEACYRLAQSHIELQHDDDAIAALRQALERGGAAFTFRAETRYRLGNLLQGKADHEGALQQFQGLVGEIDGGHYLAAAAHYGKGEAHRELGDDKAAAFAFATAAKLAKGEQAGFRFGSLYQLGFAWLRAQDLAEAGKAFAKAIEAAPDDAARAECSYLHGDVCLRREQYDAAAQRFEATRRLGGAFADDATYGLGWVALGRGDRAAALAAFGALLQEHPQSPFAGQARLERARCQYQDKRFDQAQRELQPLLADGNPLLQQARELQGLCALATGDGEAAVETLRGALERAADEDRPRLTFALGEALANLARWDEALAAYRKVPEGVDADLRGDALYGACHALHELGRFEESAACAEAVLALEPAHRSRDLAQLAVAENRFALRRYADAQPVYEALAGDGPHAALANWKLAWCRYLQGDKQDAARRFAAIARQQADDNAEEALAMSALAHYEAGARDEALAAADRYGARYRDGAFLARTERVAARVLRQRGDLGAAQRRLERAASVASARQGKDAASADVADQADLAYQQGDFAAADKLFAELSGRDDAIGARACAGRAWCAFELGDDDACAASLAAAKAHPACGDELPGLLELESALHHRRQQWPQAIAAAEAFLQRFAKHDKAGALRYALGVALARQGEHARAREVLTALLRDDGYAERDRVLYELAWACRRGGDEAAALQAFAKVAEVSEDVELAGEAHLFCGTSALEADEPDLAAARAHLEAVGGSHRKQALYRLAFAEFERAGDADRELLASARDRCGVIVAIDGAELRGEALFLGAECCRRLGDAPGALQRATTLLQEEPEHERAPRARLLVGECALLGKQPDAAIAPLQRFLREHDAEAGDAARADAARADAARANLWLGKARLAQRQHEAAEQCFTRVTRLSEGELAAEAQFRLGESRRERGDLDGAADAFVKLPILYGHAQWVRRGLLEAGRTYRQLKQPQKAQRFFQELVDKHPDSAEAKAASSQLQDN